MLGVLKRRATATDASPTTGMTCGLLTCPRCGLQLESLALRCPRCRADIPLGCDGNCRECGKTEA